MLSLTRKYPSSKVRPEGGGRQACGVYEVGLGVGLPSIADDGWVLYFLAPHIRLAILQPHGLGRRESTVLAGYLEGEEFLALVGRTEAIGMIETYVCPALAEFRIAEEGT